MVGDLTFEVMCCLVSRVKMQTAISLGAQNERPGDAGPVSVLLGRRELAGRCSLGNQLSVVGGL